LKLRGVAQVVATAGVLVYLLVSIDASAVAQSVSAIPTGALLGSVALLFGAVVVIGFFRWIVLLKAYDARRLPAPFEAARVYCGALFYNLLPGAVGGDLYRAYATRHCFDEGAIARSGSVVFVDRVLGFAALLLLVGTASLLSSSRDLHVLLYSGFGLCGAVAAIVIVSTGRHLARWFPRSLGRIVETLPAIVRPELFALAMVMSVLTQVTMAVSGHILISSLAPSVTLLDSLATFPLGTLAAYFPLAVAGGGARDMVLLVLFANLGVPRESALATSLCLFANTIFIGVSAGVLQSATRSPALPPAARTMSSDT
jgi:uncharacterized membrane protein YbhN (UPF0104 family)